MNVRKSSAPSGWRSHVSGVALTGCPLILSITHSHVKCTRCRPSLPRLCTSPSDADSWTTSAAPAWCGGQKTRKGRYPDFLACCARRQQPRLPPSTRPSSPLTPVSRSAACTNEETVRRSVDLTFQSFSRPEDSRPLHASCINGFASRLVASHTLCRQTQVVGTSYPGDP